MIKALSDEQEIDHESFASLAGLLHLDYLNAPIKTKLQDAISSDEVLKLKRFLLSSIINENNINLSDRNTFLYELLLEELNKIYPHLPQLHYEAIILPDRAAADEVILNFITLDPQNSLKYAYMIIKLASYLGIKLPETEDSTIPPLWEIINMILPGYHIDYRLIKALQERLGRLRNDRAEPATVDSFLEQESLRSYLALKFPETDAASRIIENLKNRGITNIGVTDNMVFYDEKNRIMMIGLPYIDRQGQIYEDNFLKRKGIGKNIRISLENSLQHNNPDIDYEILIQDTSRQFPEAQNIIFIFSPNFKKYALMTKKDKNNYPVGGFIMSPTLLNKILDESENHPSTPYRIYELDIFVEKVLNLRNRDYAVIGLD